ncbi:MAG: DnaJ subfamily er 11 [Chloroflexota bacterium]|jgi:curved DNA-binding protein CbpA|nr:DnaJ subfamily er 11 [Chloroflexota bacterium]
MVGILAKLTRRNSLSPADRGRLLNEAISMHREMTSDAVVTARIERLGATADDARAINADAAARVDREVSVSVALPRSAKREINYYFLLGVTPKAAPDQIRRAYRRKAKEVHPDLHAQEFTHDQWEDLMTVVADASDVLTDPRKRRAYDVFWRKRSQSIAMAYRKKGEMRGDLETRYLWEVAEMAEMEEALATLLAEAQRSVEGGSAPVAVVRALAHALDQYEGAMIEIRTSARSLPDRLEHFSERVRQEMQRKERLVRCLRQLVPGSPEDMTSADVHAMSGRVRPCIDVLAEIRQAQNQFELGTARPFI